MDAPNDNSCSCRLIAFLLCENTFSALIILQAKLGSVQEKIICSALYELYELLISKQMRWLHVLLAISSAV